MTKAAEAQGSSVPPPGRQLVKRLRARLTFQQKAFLITAIALAGWVVALYAVASRIVIGRFARLEKQDVILNVRRARAALSAQLDALDSKTGDWANWDDAYDFVHGENPEFVSKNVAPESFVQLKVDLIAFVDTSNHVVLAKGYSVDAQKDIAFPESLLRRLHQNDLLVQHPDVQSRHTGLVLLPNAALLVASRPILNTHSQGPIRGTLMFGRYLGQEEISELAETTHNDLHFYRVDASNLPADLMTAARESAKSDAAIARPVNDEQVAGYALIKDIYGEPALWLRLEMPRQIYAQGRLTMNYFLVALLAISVVFGTSAQFLLQKVIFHSFARKESEKRYRAIFEQATEGILLADAANHRILEANSALQTLLGHTDEDLRQLTLGDFCLCDDNQAAFNLQTALSNATSFSAVRHVKHRDGSWIWVEIKANLVSLEANQVFFVMFHDITERRKAEEEWLLRDRAIESAGQGIVISDPNQPDNPIIYVNAAFERLTGYSRAEAIGRNCRFLQGADTDPAAVENVRAAVRERRPVIVQLVNYRKDGTKFWNSLIVSPVFDAKGRLTHFVGSQTDVTAIKQLEEQLRQSQKMEAIGRLSGGVAHDFNNILTAMMGYCQLALEQSNGDPSLRGNIEEIGRCAERAASLTRQLLAFSRKQVFEHKVFDLNQVVGSIDRMLRRLVNEDIDIATRLVPGLGKVKGDPAQIEQVILNLVVNARDAMPNGGTLTIETANATLDEAYAHAHQEVAPGDYVMIAISDSGTGMTPEVKARIFEPFFTTKPQGQGTGLGLATCFGIVKQSQGHIAVYSEAGHGTTFKVYLPRTAETTTAASSSPSAPAKTHRGTETILLVEDEPGVRAINTRVLRSQGYKVIEANNGEEALRLAQQPEADDVELLLTDVIMPEMGGKELADLFRAKHPSTKVLFCSGYTQDAIVHRGVLEPGTAFLQKPFTPATLSGKIREVLDD
ncbi:MAG TPA: PAS domain S-box protein [Verrucomicrobiae bacterium]|nr:PAS domain S-box protein [Verrucomicrobiae bacterium]